MQLQIREDYTGSGKNKIGPMKKIVLLLSVVSLAFSFSFIQGDNLAASVERGKSVYKTNCLSCHMAEGEGLEGTFPPLAKTGRLSDKGRLVNIIFNGLSGPITVKDVEYDNEMIPMNLTNEQVTDVLNYVRNSWGNKEVIITVAEVGKLKKAGN
jgi:mono/diheme cytochrome c family protein